MAHTRLTPTTPPADDLAYYRNYIDRLEGVVLEADPAEPLCMWCARPERSHVPSAVDPGRWACPVPGVTSQFWTPRPIDAILADMGRAVDGPRGVLVDQGRLAALVRGARQAFISERAWTRMAVLTERARNTLRDAVRAYLDAVAGCPCTGPCDCLARAGDALHAAMEATKP